MHREYSIRVKLICDTCLHSAENSFINDFAMILATTEQGNCGRDGRGLHKKKILPVLYEPRIKYRKNLACLVWFHNKWY